MAEMVKIRMSSHHWLCKYKKEREVRRKEEGKVGDDWWLDATEYYVHTHRKRTVTIITTVVEEYGQTVIKDGKSLTLKVRTYPYLKQCRYRLLITMMYDPWYDSQNIHNWVNTSSHFNRKKKIRQVKRKGVFSLAPCRSNY